MKNIYITGKNRNYITFPYLYPYSRCDDIRQLAESFYLLVHLVGYGFQGFGGSLLKTGRTALYGQRTAKYGQVYLTKLVPLRPALLFEMHFSP